MAFLAGQGIAQTEQAGILVTAAPPPATFTFSPFAQFPDFGRKILTAAVISTVGVISAPFVAPQQTAVFASFQQPRLTVKTRQVIQPTQTPFIFSQPYVFSKFEQPQLTIRRRLDADTQAWLEQEPPPFTPLGFFPPFVQPLKLKAPQIADTAPWLEQEAPESLPLGFYALFDQPRKLKTPQIADTSPWLEQEPPEIITWGYLTQFDQPRWGSKIPYQTSFDFKILESFFPGSDPFVKWPDWKKKKKKRPSWEIQDEEKAERRKAIELAVYGPPVEYNFNPVNWTIPQPPNTEELARVIMQAIDQATQEQAEREAEEEERIIEMMIKDEQ